MFTAEEPTRYGIGCLGSRLMAGVLSPRKADALTDENGQTLAQARADFGLTQELDLVRVDHNRFARLWNCT